MGIDNRNWWNQYSGIEGFLLGYDIQQYGKRMRMRAREVHFEQVEDKQFEVPANYKRVDMQEMNKQLVAVVEEFI